MPLRTLHRGLGLLTLLLALLLAGPATAARAAVPPEAATIESIAGKVVNSAGSAIMAVSVTAYAPVLNDAGVRTGFRPVATASTGKDGAYSMVVPGAGSYRLGFTAPSLEPRFHPSALTVGEATDVEVTAGEAETGRDVTMLAPAVVSGTVTLASGGAYTGGGTLSLLRQVASDPVTGAAGTSWTTSSSATIGAGGAFTVTAPGAAYRARVSLPSYGVGYLPGMVGLNQASSVTLTSETTTTGVVLPLPAVSNLSGSVLDPAGEAVPGATVKPQYALVDQILNGTPVSQWTDYPGAAVSAADGRWALDVMDRTYRVRATGTLGGKAYTAFHPDAPTVVTATDVRVSGRVTGIDITVLKPVATSITNTSRPWVGGGAKATAVLTANPGTWSPESRVTFSYQWLENGAPIGGATEPTYAIGLLASGGRYSVVVTAKATGLPDAVVTSLATGPAAGLLGTAAFENRALPVIKGTAATGATLTATSGQWSTTPDAISYQWTADGVDIAGATQQTFVPTPAQFGRQLAVKVTAVAGIASATAVAAPTARVQEGPIRNLTPPTITGTAKSGQALTAVPGTWSAAEPAFGYQWLADGTPIAGATAATLTPGAAQVGKRLSVRVSATLTGYKPGAAESAKTDPVQPLDQFVLGAAPTVSGSAQEGQTLTAGTGTWTPTPTTFLYRWRADGTLITGATSPTYAVRAADVGKPISVTIIARRADLEDGIATSAATAPVTAEPITVSTGPSLTGTPLVGQVLQALPGAFAPGDVVVAYAWLRSGVPVEGAAGPTFALTTADLGSNIAVRTTYSRPGAAPVVRTSRTTTKVKSTPTLSVRPSSAPGSQVVRLRIGVAAPGVDAVSGTIRVFENGRKLAEQVFSGGRLTVRLANLTRGLHTFTVKLVQAGYVASGVTRSSIRVD